MDSIYTRGLQESFILREIEDDATDYVVVEENSQPVAFLIIDGEFFEDSVLQLVTDVKDSYSLYFILFLLLSPSYNEKFLRFQDKFEYDHVSILPVVGDHTMIACVILEILEVLDELKALSKNSE